MILEVFFLISVSAQTHSRPFYQVIPDLINKGILLETKNNIVSSNDTRQISGLPCGATASLHDREEITLETPHYPALYPHRMRCRWNLMIPAGDHVRVFCETFHVSRGDSFSIWGVLPPIHGVAPQGFQFIIRAQSRTRNMRVYFTSNTRTRGHGFRCTFDAENGDAPRHTVGPSAPPPTAPSGSCQCGIKGVAESPRIVGGQEADEHEYPWQVGLVNVHGQTPWCGGTLISHKHVLTAAHCTEERAPKDIQVLLGEHRTNDDYVHRVDVSAILDDPKYDFPDNDFSILTLAQPVTFSNSMRPVCLSGNTAKNYTGHVATVTGWGALSSGGNQPTVLMEVDVTVTSNSLCSEVYQGINSVDSRHICAMEDGKDSCQGDSGGPLVIKENNRWTLIGVTSFGYMCALPGAPGVYGRVAHRFDWIQANTEGISTSYC